MKQKIFLDTNVWYSALYGSQTCKMLVQAHIDGEITAVVSPKVLDELIKNLNKKIPHALPEFKRMLLRVPPYIVPDPTHIPTKIQLLVDKKDQKIFVSAVKSKVKYFVTGNTKDFSVLKLEKLTGIKVVTPREVVELFALK